MPEQIKIERILFATDFLENSRLALDYAVGFAEHFHASIVMLHVVLLSQAAREAEIETAGPSVSRLSAEQRLETLAEGVRRLGIQVETHVVDGLTCETIIRSIKTYQTDLLVLGTHGVHRGLDHLLIGSNTEKLLLAAECPVLTVGAHALSGFDVNRNIQEILYFSDFTPEATAAAPYAMFLGKEFGVPVEPCLLIPDAAEQSDRIKMDMASEYCEKMQSILGEEHTDWCRPNFQLERGMELDQIISRAESQSAALIVLGVHAETQLGRRLHTSFAYQVLARATCPIVTLRRPATG